MATLDYVVDESQRLQLNNEKVQVVNVNIQNNLELEIDIPGNTHGSALINVRGQGTFKLNVIANEGADWSILMMNESDQDIEFYEDWHLKKDANIALAIGELTNGNHTKHIHYHLLEEGSTINVRGANLVQSKLVSMVKAIHYKGNTYAQIDNYGIVLEHCEYTLDVIGQIEKAARNSKTHQTSRIMNFGDDVKTSVNPKLIIEENDVEASHAASMGQPDPLQVYYLQSRGMDRTEALKLISLGYLLPIVEYIEDEHIKETLRDAVIEKVGNSCLM
ncbi:MAG: SufD family Fe-S cluster assembly protein [Erysipelothrix sp.]|jgi:Fe-S cluster assembly scaffold protein SufB|nr:SufD family Fe-S cluster assembly protein [Erysipelothrix sp.]